MSRLIDAVRQRVSRIAEFADALKGDDPIEGAVMAQGVVVAIEPTGTSVALGGIEHYFCRVTVRVTVPGEAPYIAVCTHKMASWNIALVQLREIDDSVPVAVEVDPHERLHVRVRWDFAIRAAD